MTRRLATLVAVVLAAGLGRMVLTALLSYGGLAWSWAHDVPLGVGYALMIGLALHYGGWTETTARSAAAAG